MKTRRREKRRTKGNTLFDKVKRISIRGVKALKTAKPNRNTLFTNTKRKKKNSEFIFAKHKVKRNNNFVRMENREVRDNMFDKQFEGRIGRRREGSKETSKTTFSRIKANRREMIFQFSGDVRGNNRFRNNHTSNNKGKIFKKRFRESKNIGKKINETT